MELFHNINEVKANLRSTMDHFQNGILVKAIAIVKIVFSRAASQLINYIGTGDTMTYNNQVGALNQVAIRTTSIDTTANKVNSVPIRKTSTFSIFKKDPRRIHQPDLTFDLVGENMASTARDIALDIVSEAHLTGKISNSIFITKNKTYRLVLFAFEGVKCNEHSESLMSLKNDIHNALLHSGCITSQK